jgi:hypothetical protein
MKIMLDTARCFSYIVLHSTTAPAEIPFINNSFEPIMKMTLGALVYGEVRFGDCKHNRLKRRI